MEDGGAVVGSRLFVLQARLWGLALASSTASLYGQLHVRARLRRVARTAGTQILSPPHLCEPDLPYSGRERPDVGELIFQYNPYLASS